MSRNKSQRPLNVSFRHGSPSEQILRQRTGRPLAAAIATGIKATPAHDLRFHGGKTIAHLHFMNFYVGADVWPADDVTNIDKSLAAAMADPQLNNVMEQYFPAQISSTFDGSEKLTGPAPETVSQGDIEALVASLATEGKFAGRDLGSTVFNFMLPPGTILNADAKPTASVSHNAKAVKENPIPDDDDGNSLQGLGGYHGSVHVSKNTIYYAVGVYSETRADGTENGIPVFDKPWKNVVATFYHELNEARTDADVEDAIRAGNDPNANRFLGWTSDQGEECGDFPVFESGNNLSKVFQEVPLTAGGGTVPVQFQYSDNAHGPEGPRATPAHKASALSAVAS
jgi:hypothetical protein